MATDVCRRGVYKFRGVPQSSFHRHPWLAGVQIFECDFRAAGGKPKLIHSALAPYATSSRRCASSCGGFSTQTRGTPEGGGSLSEHESFGALASEAGSRRNHEEGGALSDR